MSILIESSQVTGERFSGTISTRNWREIGVDGVDKNLWGSAGLRWIHVGRNWRHPTITRRERQPRKMKTNAAVPVSHSNANARIDRKSKFPIYPFENEISKRENRREGKKSEGESKEKGKVPRKTFLSHPWKTSKRTTVGNRVPQIFIPRREEKTFYVLEQSEKENVARGELFSSLFSRLRSSLRSLITTFLWQCRGTILPSLSSPLLHLFSRAADTLNVDIHWRNVYVTSRTNKRANKRNEFEIEFTEFQILLR